MKIIDNVSVKNADSMDMNLVKSLPCASCGQRHPGLWEQVPSRIVFHFNAAERMPGGPCEHCEGRLRALQVIERASDTMGDDPINNFWVLCPLCLQAYPAAYVKDLAARS